MELGDGIKKLLLAGIGTAAITAEKSKDILDELVKKGELTVEQGKVLNQELKHTVKETVKNSVNVSVKASSPEELNDLLGKMTPEQLAALKKQLEEMESRKAAPENETEEDTAEAPSEEAGATE